MGFKNLSAEEALERLKEGNQHFIADTAKRPRADSLRRYMISGRQTPYAVVLTCADSRVVPELIFDQGLGDLFVIRVAGNIIDKAVLGSIEYACIHLGINLVLVLGHQSCGAVSAAVAGTLSDLHIDELVLAILPAVAETAGMLGDRVDLTVRANARLVAESLSQTDPILAKLVAERSLRMQGGYYCLESGAVEFFPPPA